MALKRIAREAQPNKDPDPPHESGPGDAPEAAGHGAVKEGRTALFNALGACTRSDRRRRHASRGSRG
jgi:hypothetical protein